MKRSFPRYAFLAAALFIWVSAIARSQPTELFFSEYIEGTSNNKALEIFNGTGSAVNLLTNSYNVQMFFNGSATAGLTINLTGSVASGDVYVVAQSSANATILAQADQTSGAGWFNGDDAVVLRKGTTIIDVIGQIGFDPGTEWGSGLTSTADNTLRRKCSITVGDTNGSNAFDPSVEWDGFATDTFGGLGSHCVTGPTGVGAANPSAVEPGDTTLLTVTVTPGTNPTSTGIAVTGDLSSIGGSAAQAFRDDGLSGDVTAGDNIFSFSATVHFATSTGNKSLPATITDAQGRTGSATIPLSVFQELAIYEIQGTGSTSPVVGQVVRTTGIVTGVRFNNGFFIQDPVGDADPNTSEGIFVFTSSPPPPAVVVGNEVRVTGTVFEFIPPQDPFSPPVTEIVGPLTVSVISTGNPLPAAMTLTAADTSPSGSIEQLEKYEGMRVSVSSLTVIAPTMGSINEPNATSTSNGVFYGVITGISRPFREPGIETPDPVPDPPCCIPVFDANPERLRVDSDGQVGATALEVTTGAVVTGLIGPLDYSFRTYTILPDPGSSPGVSGNISAIPVRVRAADEFTVASFNLERFFDTTNDPGVSDVALTPTAFENRLNKVSLAIRDVLRSPDILGVIEVENLTTLQAIATRLNTDDTTLNYVAYLEEGNDIGGIDVGFLINDNRVNVVDVTQIGKTATFINPNTGLPETLNDRPPLVLRATVDPPAGSPFPITVIVVHQRSLNGIDSTVPNGSGTEGDRVRAKRNAQAQFLANYVQGRQTADPNEHIAVVGDFNAFQFNDGYVDPMGTVEGTPTPSDQVVLASSDLVNPDLTNLIETLPPTDRYSYVFDGNAQVLDHILMTGNLTPRFLDLEYARLDADFPESFRNDPNRPERISDHDAPVAYFSAVPRLFALSPADVWIGLANSDDVGIRFDLRAEIYRNGSVVGSGELASVPGGSSGFNNAKLDSIPLTLTAPVNLTPGDTLSIKLLVRNACSGSGKNSGRAQLWFNDAAANSHFDATIDTTANYYLRDAFELTTTPGSGPKKTINVQAGAKCSAYKPFGTWTTTLN